MVSTTLLLLLLNSSATIIKIFTFAPGIADIIQALQTVRQMITTKLCIRRN